MNSLIRNLETFITHNKNYNLKHFIPNLINSNEFNKFSNKNNDKSILYRTLRYDIVGVNLDKDSSINVNDKYEHGYIYKIVNGKVKEEIDIPKKDPITDLLF